MRLSPESLRSLEKATATYQANVDLARTYLSGRGLTHATAVSCRLGVVLDPIPGHEAFTGRLAIPYLTRAGVVNIKFRALDGEEPKYLCLPGAKPKLYNVNAFFVDTPDVALTEGELDAAVLTQIGVPAVGSPGASTWLPHYPRLFAGYDRVLVFTDGDDAGRQFGKRAASDLDNAVVIPMPQGMDVTDVFIRDGAEALRERAGLE